MHTRHPIGIFLAGLALLVAGNVVAGTTPHAFTAHYQVLRDGNTIGTVSMTLRAQPDGTWRYISQMRGTSGLAGLLGASLDEDSLLRWRDGRPETLDYRYHMSVAFKDRKRHVHVDWSTGTVHVTQDGKMHQYPVHDGLVDQHAIPLALGLALAGGAHDITLPVAVKDRVEMQHYRVTGDRVLDVPVGRYRADRVDRIDKDKAFSAWYVPGRYPIPVKLRKDGKDKLSLLLQRFTSN
jgi:hypothetical protein